MLIAIRNRGAAVCLAALAAGCGGVSQEKYNAAVTEADKYKQDANTQAQRVADCEQKITAMSNKVQGLETTNTTLEQKNDDYKAMTQALAADNAAGMVEIANLSGLVTIRLPEKLLFAPGSAAIVKGGKAELKRVAAAMKGVSGRVFYVAGNTDNKPIRTKQFPSNWELSTARALAVVKFFLTEGVDPKTLGVAAYAQYHPIASNDTAEGRARNRRIDIGMSAPPSDLPSAK
jgi:flagellar motor protein MotB